MFRGEKVTLEPFHRQHLASYLEWVNDAELASQVGRALPVTDFEHQRWYEEQVTRPDAVFFAVRRNDDGRYIGNVWLWAIHPVHRHGELRILLGDRESQGRGCGTEACRMLVQFAFRHLNLEKVYLYVLATNLRAVKAFEKAGFRREGLLKKEFFVDGSYRDVYRMAVLRSEA